MHSGHGKLDIRALLPCLREIGFRHWDPLGLRDCLEDSEPINDEYDSYLLKAFAAAINSNDMDRVIQVLRDGEKIMGVQTTKPIRSATAAEILKIASDTGKTRAN
jgi:hypothetical protein